MEGSLLAFLGVSAVVIITPGQDTALTIRNTLMGGRSAGVATAEELARVAVSAADSGRQIVGILVADPDPADSTTGRIPQPGRTAGARAPSHLTGIPTETRQWMTQKRRSR